MGCVDYIRLNHEVCINEVRWVSGVGVNASNLSCSQVNLCGSLHRKEFIHCLLIAQIKFGMRARNDLTGGNTLSNQGTKYRTTHHTFMARDKNPAILVNHY
ncbi:hypothetical protein DLREEDagrD3_22800 [Denitratisoma sp. agr-D3]